jgi:quercetin dioxygenase-like cupin family protein
MLQVDNRYTFFTDLLPVANDSTEQSLKTISLFHHKHFNVMLWIIPTGHSIKENVFHKMLNLQIISGRGCVSLGDETHAVKQGAWFYIAPSIPHEIVSDETLIVLLSLYTLPKSTNGVLEYE